MNYGAMQEEYVPFLTAIKDYQRMEIILVKFVI